MSKKNEPAREHSDVIWRLSGDALRPKDAPWGFIAQNPVQRVVPPSAKMTIDTGIAASVPMVCFPRGDQADYVKVPTILPAGQNLVVTIENTSAHSPLVVDDKQSVANMFPMIFRGTSEVD